MEDESNKDTTFTERNSIRAEVQKSPESIWFLSPQLPSYFPTDDAVKLSLADKVKRHIEVRDEVDNAGG